jgi:uncharacterized tellurite resistance protein B-like protein
MEDPGSHFIRELDEERLEALIETMYLVAFADGEYGEAERVHFSKSIDGLTGGRLAGETFDHVIERIVRQLQSGGLDGCIASLKRRLDDPQLRQVALILATDMAAADGVLHPHERSLIIAMAKAFEMDPDAAREVLDGPTPEAETP